MNWKKVIKKKSSQPKTGKYNDPSWKLIIALQCYNQCVYCAIKEGSFGGARNFHVEHFRPKSLPKFKYLVNNIMNLFYACSICNCFKKDDWPGEPKLNKISYCDPSKVDYSNIFDIDKHHLLKGNCISAKYMIEKLFMNRPQLIFERREVLLLDKFKVIRKKIKETKAKLIKIDDTRKKLDLLNKLTDRLLAIQDLIDNRRNIVPYSLNDITRQ